jgi:cellulose biosynthesis protein BcsQ
MNILALTSQKGGSGKTTLAGHLAVAAEIRGAGPVAVIDTDPQGSLTDWWNERQAPTPSFLSASIATLAHDLDHARDLGFKLVIIDTPPAITDMIEHVIALSDLVAIPTRPSRSAGRRHHHLDGGGNRKTVGLRDQRSQSPRADHRRSRCCAFAARHGRTRDDPPEDRFRRQHDRWPHRHGTAAIRAFIG